MPLYRQMQRFERGGVKLSYSTLSDWISSTCKLITPLYEALKAQVLQTTYLQVNETPIKVLDKDKKGASHRGYYWGYCSSAEKIVFFDYQPGRGQEGPMEILENFAGYLQTDGYAVFDVFDRRENITLLHCMALARRMFNEALENDASRAGYAMEQIQKSLQHRKNLQRRKFKLCRNKRGAPAKVCAHPTIFGPMDERTIHAGYAQKYHRQGTCLQHWALEKFTTLHRKRNA